MSEGIKLELLQEEPIKPNVPNLLDLVNKEDIYEVKIENVYDPSKFWLILKCKELVLFMNYLKCFYNNSENKINIPRHKLKSNLLCIVSRNNLYYRSLILPVLFSDNKKLRVFMIDIGLIINVSVDDIFYIFKKHTEVPKFAIRASLAYIAPRDQSKKWTISDLKTFFAIITGKRLFIKVCEIDTDHSILYIDVQIYIRNSICESVSKILVNSKIAIYNKDYQPPKPDSLKKYKPKVKYLHLFPTFEALESGRVPSSIWEYDLLKNSVPLDILHGDYYKYEDSDAK